jgi:hypothetical protein
MATDIFHNPASFAASYLQPTYFWTTLVLVLLFSYGPFISNRGRKLPGIPVAGARSVLEPEIVTRYRSVTQAWAVVDDGYRKVGCLRSMYCLTTAPFPRVARKDLSWEFPFKLFRRLVTILTSIFLTIAKFKDSAFTVLRPDSTLTVLPNRYVDELRNVPNTTLDGIAAIVEVRHVLVLSTYVTT